MELNRQLSSGARRSILVVGSSNTDMTIQVPRIPRTGETILGGKFTSAAGGKGANQAVGAARAGGQVTFIGRVGGDVFGKQALSGLLAEGINTDHVIRDGKSTSGVALIFVDQAGQNSIAVASGANGKLSPADIKKAAPAFRQARMLLVQLETPLKTVQAAVDLAVANNVPVVLNPAPAQALPAKLLAKLYLLTPNQSEAELLTGIAVHNEADAGRAADHLLAMGVKNVIITLGEQGVYVAGPNIRQLIPGYRMKAVDTTAAGDIFNGALTVALAEGRSLVEAARFANAAAALSVTRPGAQDSAPTRQEIQRLLTTTKPVEKSPRLNGFAGNGTAHSLQLNGKG